MNFKVLAAALASVVLAAGCGGGSAQKSDTDQIRETTKTFIQALVNGDNAKACEATSDPGKCLGELALAQGFLGANGSWKTVFPDGWEANMEKAKIAVHGNTATMAAWSASGHSSDGKPDTFKKIDGSWQLIFSDDSSGSSSSSSSSSDQQPSTADQPTGPLK